MTQNNPSADKNTNKPAHKNNYDIDIQTCSAMDCTGLIPSLPEDEAQREAYEELYPYLIKAK